MIIFYPDKSLKFLFKKFKLLIFNYKNQNFLKNIKEIYYEIIKKSFEFIRLYPKRWWIL